jgi:hypothetical protein
MVEDANFPIVECADEDDVSKDDDDSLFMNLEDARDHTTAMFPQEKSSHISVDKMRESSTTDAEDITEVPFEDNDVQQDSNDEDFSLGPTGAQEYPADLWSVNKGDETHPSVHDNNTLYADQSGATEESHSSSFAEEKGVVPELDIPCKLTETAELEQVNDTKINDSHGTMDQVVDELEMHEVSSVMKGTNIFAVPRKLKTMLNTTVEHFTKSSNAHHAHMEGSKLDGAQHIGDQGIELHFRPQDNPDMHEVASIQRDNQVIQLSRNLNAIKPSAELFLDSHSDKGLQQIYMTGPKLNRAHEIRDQGYEVQRRGHGLHEIHEVASVRKGEGKGLVLSRRIQTILRKKSRKSRRRRM